MQLRPWRRRVVHHAHLKPAEYTGLDYNPDGVAYCNEHHKLPGLNFVHGNAEDLPFPDNSFDAVVNVEASHAYPTLSKFLSEVARVLKPGGDFLYADFRGRPEFPVWEGLSTRCRCVRFRSASSTTVWCAHWTPAHKHKLDLISDRLPKVLRPFSRHFAGVPGTGIYNVIDSGGAEYRIYHFTKD